MSNHSVWEQHILAGYKQTNQAAIEFALKTIWSLFLLNGAASTALFASKDTLYYGAAIWLALGAFCAVIAFGVSYLYSLLLAETWRPGNENEKTYPISFLKWKKELTDKDIGDLRIVPIGCVLCSMILFIIGMGICICNVW